MRMSMDFGSVHKPRDRDVNDQKLPSRAIKKVARWGFVGLIFSLVLIARYPTKRTPKISSL